MYLRLGYHAPSEHHPGTNITGGWWRSPLLGKHSQTQGPTPEIYRISGRSILPSQKVPQDTSSTRGEPLLLALVQCWSHAPGALTKHQQAVTLLLASIACFPGRGGVGVGPAATFATRSWAGLRSPTLKQGDPSPVLSLYYRRRQISPSPAKPPVASWLQQVAAVVIWLLLLPCWPAQDWTAQCLKMYTWFQYKIVTCKSLLTHWGWPCLADRCNAA